MKKYVLLLLSLVLTSSILLVGGRAYQAQIHQAEATKIEEKREASPKNLPTVIPTQSSTPASEKLQQEIKTTENQLSTVQETPLPITTANSTPLPIPTPTPTPMQIHHQENQPEEKIVYLSIESVGDFTVNYQTGDMGWDIMKRAAAIYHFAMTYKEYTPFGIYVMRIGDKEAAGTYYWALYYNNAYSMLGISDLTIQPNDRITWKYESWM